MKAIAAILLMGILLFNWIGYQVLYSYAQVRSDKQLESRLDKNQYKEEDLISITLPLHMPYFSDQSEFQRVDGAVTVNGMQYKFVKRRVHNDSVTLLCLPDQRAMKLVSERNNYFRFVSDLQHSGKSKDHTVAFKSFLSEYEEKLETPIIPTVQDIAGIYSSLRQVSYSFCFIDRTEHPPRLSGNLV